MFVMVVVVTRCSNSRSIIISSSRSSIINFIRSSIQEGGEKEGERIGLSRVGDNHRPPTPQRVNKNVYTER